MQASQAGSPLPLEAAAPVSMQIDFDCVRFALVIDAELCIHGYAARYSQAY